MWVSEAEKKWTTDVKILVFFALSKALVFPCFLLASGRSQDFTVWMRPTILIDLVTHPSENSMPQNAMV